ncbi:hypothetical protein [Planctomyces sp. SH-PL14]|uniref:hypothetical protein n=1 Tax=Planctomyces sp. SH-PL14 TaxID=1632864 RepID=UPI00078ECB4E|nr:hypothetical protein [Planctomyces sp. SH-PL14]AMV20806.1 hypothetical protein VT03_23090 [Planctomyces sp. SH-PL14]
MDTRVSDVLRRIEAILIETIPAAIQAARLSEPVYCLRIWYNGTDSDSDAIPWLMPVKEVTRQAILKKAKGRFPEGIWLADELTNVGQAFNVDIKNAELTEQYGLWYEHLAEQDDEEDLQLFREMVQRVSAALNRLDWSALAPVTDDFVVFPADGSHTFGDDLEDLRASVPADRLQLLKSRKLWK